VNNLKVHFSSESDDWATPQRLFNELSAKYGPFDLDAAASAENTKCKYFIDAQTDALKFSWYDHLQIYNHYVPLVRCIWVNPPYSRGLQGKFIAKAAEEAKKGCRVVMLLPARTDTVAFHTYIYNKPNVTIEFLKGRLKFGDAKNSAPFPSMVVRFDPPGDVQ
jgi:phage N-6-adenine-methyltransferase